MFMYWNAPPSLLRIWACPEDPFPIIDGRFRLGSPGVRAGHEWGSRLSRIGGYVRALLGFRPVVPGSRLAEPALSAAEGVSLRQGDSLRPGPSTSSGHCSGQASLAARRYENSGTDPLPGNSRLSL